MLALSLLILMLALLGHGALWVGIINRWHGTGFSRLLVKSVTLVFYAALFGLPLLVARHWLRAEHGLDWFGQAWPSLDAAAAYTAVCAAIGAIHLPLWAAGRLRRPPATVKLRGERIVDVCELVGRAPTTSPRTRLFCCIPFNQLWQLSVPEYEVEISGLPASLDGLSICHVSDLHYSPRIDRAYFDEVVRLTNEMQPDLIALTGDVCDKARFIDWIPLTLGRMQARIAKLYVLGNHDLRTHDVARLRATLRKADFVDVGGRMETLVGQPIVVAGNERPWFREAAPVIDRLPVGAFKLLLSHSPDQFSWGREQGFDLMLAGHTHGGQIRFPLAGPVICPSWHGTKYAGGFFHSEATLMHVSRGTASLFPYRMNCRPELTKLVLRSAP
jgi:predicted MPP superfamily phosphohydrolase